MREVYGVLRLTELDVLRLQKEVKRLWCKSRSYLAEKQIGTPPR
jgi:hypothetical protein